MRQILKYIIAILFLAVMTVVYTPYRLLLGWIYESESSIVDEYKMLWEELT